VSEFCRARNAEADTVCSRRTGHDGHHCDSLERHAWTDGGPTDCPNGYDHGQPPNRATRRGNTTHRSNHLARKFPGDPRG
jgi:hypothetical protein